MNLASPALQALYEREIAAAYTEDTATIRNTCTAYFAECGEALPPELRIELLSAGRFVLEGAAVTAPLIGYLRGAGLEVQSVGNTALAKLRKRQAKPQSLIQRMQAKTKGGGRLSQLEFFNDDDHLRIAKKLYETTVEANDWRYFPQFLKELDELIGRARDREGHEDESAQPAKRAAAPAPLHDNRGKKTLANLGEEA